MKKFVSIISMLILINFANAQQNNNSSTIQQDNFNSKAITDYLSSVSGSQLKSALGLDIDTQASTKLLDGIFLIWKNTFSESNSDIGQVVIKLYDNMKMVLQGLSFDIKTEKFNDGLILKTLINYPYKEGFKTFKIDYYLKRDGNFWKVYDLKIGGLDVFPIYKIIHKP